MFLNILLCFATEVDIGHNFSNLPQLIKPHLSLLSSKLKLNMGRRNDSKLEIWSTQNHFMKFRQFQLYDCFLVNLINSYQKIYTEVFFLLLGRISHPLIP